MPRDLRQITPQDLLPDAEFAKARKDRRAELLQPAGRVIGQFAGSGTTGAREHADRNA